MSTPTVVMETVCIVCMLLVTLTSGAPLYYIIVRLSPATSGNPLGAQFEQIHPSKMNPKWECKSGLTPITYPTDLSKHVQAKSMDLEVGSEVECLSLVVRVVEGEQVSLWEGDESHCDKGYITTTTELARTDEGVEMFFKLIPATPFSVYTSDPGQECAKQVFKYLAPPKLEFINHPALKCRVISKRVGQISCNMTIATSPDDVMALATSTTEIVVPTFVWKINVQTITCSCSCLIKHPYSATNSDRSVSLNFTSPRRMPPDFSEPDEFQKPERRLTTTPSDIVLLSVGVLSAMLLMTLISTIYLATTTRALRRKLKRARDCGMRHQGTPRPPPSIPRPPGDYSHVHRVSNTCHHYNTVSLQLSDYLAPSTGAPDMQPVYQKLKSLTTQSQDASSGTGI